MTPAQRERVREVFNAVCDSAEQDRAFAVERLCGNDLEVKRRVEALLEADGEQASADASFLEGPAIGRLADLERQAIGAAHPEAIGNIGGGAYQIVRLIGFGGMGAVYEAQQRSPSRRVAIKLLRPLAGHSAAHELARRFQYEAQILGTLAHPGVARIYESGSSLVEYSDGSRIMSPYFAMELIAGTSITAYAAEQDLDVRSRVELLALVCEAVEHAHQKGVIHRDLKPGNIMVDQSGQPKVLDFGVARLLNAEEGATLVAAAGNTRPGEVLGTLAYMAPEQVRGEHADIDTRTDVYALGVIGYELLAGRLPLEMTGRSLTQIAALINEERPAPLGRVNPRLRGDTEIILGKALEKDLARRYSSAAEFAADLRRFLADQPIAARADTAIYVLRKFARRNRALVAWAAAVGAAVVTGLVGTLWFAVKARTSAEVAERRAALAGEGADLLFDKVIRELPNLSGAATLQRQVVEAAAAHYERLLAELPDDPRQRVRIAASFEFLAQAHRQLAEMDRARSAAERFNGLAVDNLRSSPGDLDRRHDLVRSLIELDRSTPTRFTADLERAITEGEALIAADPDNLAYLSTLGNAYVDFVRAANSGPHVRAGEIAARMAALAPDDERTLALQNRVADHIANYHLAEKNFAGAVGVLETTIARQRSLVQKHPANTTARRNLAIFLNKLGEARLAEQAAEEALAAYVSAEAETAQLLNLEPGNAMFSGIHADALLGLGEIELQRGNLAAACRPLSRSMRDACRHLASLPKNHQYFHNLLGWRLLKLFGAGIRTDDPSTWELMREALEELKAIERVMPYGSTIWTFAAANFKAAIEGPYVPGPVSAAGVRSIAQDLLDRLESSSESSDQRQELLVFLRDRTR